MSETLSNKLLAIAEKIASQKYIMAIQHAFTALIPVIITGSFCTLAINVICATDGTGISLAKVPGMAWLSMFTDWFSAVNYATLNFFTVAAVVLIGLEMGRENKLKGYFPGIIALCSFIACLSTTVTVTDGDYTGLLSGVLSKDYTGSRGLFLGIFISILSVEIYTRLLNSDHLKIKMPDSVPGNVANSFNALFPAMITILSCALLNWVLSAVFGKTLYDVIYTFLQTPLEKIAQGLPGVLVMMLVAQLFWCIGIHGNQIIKVVRDPLLNAAILANTEMVAEGITDISQLNIINMSFWDTYMSFGGSGCTIGLVIAILIFSKRSDYKAIAKLEVGPGLFNINEPMTFGLPIVFNPLMMIPFIITPMLTGIFAYVMTKIGFAGVCVYAIPWTTPPILSAWLSTGGSLGAVITQLICIAMSIVIYVPFVILANKTAPQEAMDTGETTMAIDQQS